MSVESTDFVVYRTAERVAEWIRDRLDSLPSSAISSSDVYEWYSRARGGDPLAEERGKGFPCVVVKTGDAAAYTEDIFTGIWMVPVMIEIRSNANDTAHETFFTQCGEVFNEVACIEDTINNYGPNFRVDHVQYNSMDWELDETRNHWVARETITLSVTTR